MRADEPTPSRTVRWAFAALALGVVALGVWLRTRTLRDVFVGGEVIPSDSDCSYHLRRALLTLERFPWVPARDPWVVWPDGATPTNGPGADLVYAAAAFALGARGAPDRAAHIIACVPVLLGIVSALAAALAAARLEPVGDRRPPAALCALAFSIAIPLSVRISSVGFIDHHVFESLAPLAFFAWMAARRDAPTLRWETHGAVLIAATVFLYPGTLVSHALLATGLALFALFEDRPAGLGRVGSGAPAFAMASGLLLAVAAPWTRSHRQWMHHLQLSFLQPALLLGAAVALSLVALVGRRVTDGAPLPRALRRAAIASASIAVVIGLVLAAAPALRRELVAGISGWLLTRDPWMASIAECLPMFPRGPFERDAWREIFLKYSALAPFVPVFSAVAVRRVARTHRAAAFVLGVTLTGLVALTLLQHRFARALVGPFSVVAALSLVELFDRVAARRSESQRAWAAIGLCALWIAVDPSVRVGFTTSPVAPLDGLHEAAIALRRTSAPVRHGERAGVLTSWEVGNDALLLGRRPVLETGFGPYLGRAAFEASERAWRASEAELVAWLDRRDAGEVLIWGRHILSLGGARPPLASRAARDGRTILNPEYFRKYPIAVTMLAGSGDARRGLPHLAHLRPRFASSQFLAGFAVPLPLPWAWIFERVEGVTLRGLARDGALVRVTLPLMIRDETTLWEAWTRADHGAWRVTVPIPTSHREGSVISGSRYTVFIDDRVAGRATASLDEVRAGAEREVTSAPPTAHP